MTPRFPTSDSYNEEFLLLKSNTEAVWGPHAVFGLAPIGAHDHVKLRIEDKNDLTMPESSVQVQFLIVALLLG